MKRLSRWVSFILFFLKELWISNFRVARDVMRKNPRFNPAFVAVPLDIKSEFGIMILANTITLTPGTLSVDVSADKSILYLHTMYMDTDKETFCRDIKAQFESRVRGLIE